MKVTTLNTFELFTISSIVQWARTYNSYAQSFRHADYGYKDGGKIHIAKMYNEMCEFETALGYCKKTAVAFGYAELKAAVEQLMQEHAISNQTISHA